MPWPVTSMNYVLYYVYKFAKTAHCSVSIKITLSEDISDLSRLEIVTRTYADRPLDATFNGFSHINI